jgi:hypothetical protein
MKFNFSAPFYLLLAVPLFFASCSKEGPAGAQGPAGPAGPTGAAGAAGAQGAQGDPGTANVIYSTWLDVTFQPDTATNASTGMLDTLGYSAEIPAPQLVDSILNQGDVKVYWNAGSSTDTSYSLVLALPFNDLLRSGILTNVYFSRNIISLYANADLTTYTQSGNNYSQFRYILIPGGTPAGRNATGTINWNNYAEVKKYLGLKD